MQRRTRGSATAPLADVLGRRSGAHMDSYESDDADSIDSMDSVRSDMDTEAEVQPRLLSRTDSGEAKAAAAKASGQQHMQGHVTTAEAFSMRSRMRDLLALCKLPVTLSIGDRRGRVRDAAAAQGCLAISVDECASESEHNGLHVRLDARVLCELPPVERLFTFMPCEQQALSLGPRMAAIKALDGRMFWGVVQWIRAWCIRARCAYAEQPDTYIIDFYDANHMLTCLSQWNCGWQKRTVIFARGAALPVPPSPGATGSLEWHHRRSGGAEAQARARDETPVSMAQELVRQCVPTGDSEHLDADIEVERFAAAWHLSGLPVPEGYDAAHGLPPTSEAQLYSKLRGVGDGRRVAGGTVPKLLLPNAPLQAPTAEESEEAQRNWMHRKWQRVDVDAKLEGVTVPPVSRRGLQLARTARNLLASEVAAAATVQISVLDARAIACEAVVVIPARTEGSQLLFLLPAAGEHFVVGTKLRGAAGLTATTRKEGTAAAKRVLKAVYDVEADADTGYGVRVAPVCYCKLQKAEVAVVAAWAPQREREAEERAGLLWYAMSQIRCAAVAALCQRVAWSANGWTAPQRDVFSKDRRGAIAPSLTALNGVAAAPPLDVEAAETQLARDMEQLTRELRGAADKEPHIASQLLLCSGATGRWRPTRCCLRARCVTAQCSRIAHAFWQCPLRGAAEFPSRSQWSKGGRRPDGHHTSRSPNRCLQPSNPRAA